MKFLTLEQAKKEGFKLEGYFERELKEKNQEVGHFNTICKLVEVVYYSFYEGKKHFEHCAVLLEYKGVLLRPYHVKYNSPLCKFFLAESINIPSFSHKLEEPQNVGSPTAKKMDKWLNYLQSIEKLKQEELDRRNNKETDFLSQLKNSGLKVVYTNPDNKRGYIDSELATYEFEVHYDGSISQNIRLRCSSNLENFIKLTQ